jgi:hypothetical protein
MGRRLWLGCTVLFAVMIGAASSFLESDIDFVLMSHINRHFAMVNVHILCFVRVTVRISA